MPAGVLRKRHGAEECTGFRYRRQAVFRDQGLSRGEGREHGEQGDPDDLKSAPAAAMQRG